MPSVEQIIAAINPELYHSVSDDPKKGQKELKEFKEKIKKDGIAKAAEGAKPKPLAVHNLVYDSSSETLEPIYFFILDAMNDFNFKTEKYTDNFVSSPGSGHFAELGQRATIMQQQGTKILGDVNTVLRSVLNIIYDLKDFKIRLESYKGLKSKNKAEQDAARLSLKQIWLDKVDMIRGNSSLKAMAMQGGFQTLLHAFLAVKDESLKDDSGNEIDLNDVVKRILKPRIQEFNIWLNQSEEELKKRYELERTYLKSQVNSLNLYSRWAKPYLKAAAQLEMKESGRNPALVKTFNTILLELVLLGKKKTSPETENKAIEKMFKRNYYACIMVEFNFRGIPQRMSGQQSHYVFGGRTEVSFKAYALNEDELDKLNEETKKSDIGDVLKLIEGTTTESLEQLQKEIDSFIKEKPEEEKSEEKAGDTNPFMALIGKYEGETKQESKKEEKKEKKTIGEKIKTFFVGEKKKTEKKEKEIQPDNFIEAEHQRSAAQASAVKTVFDLFDMYKKVHGMSSYT